MFIYILLTLIIIFLIHHRYKHRNDLDKMEMDKWFQISDILNHETWIVFMIGIIIGISYR